MKTILSIKDRNFIFEKYGKREIRTAEDGTDEEVIVLELTSETLDELSNRGKSVIDPLSNTTAYIVINENDYDPERHMLPVFRGTASPGKIVGLLPSAVDKPEEAELVEDATDLWIYSRFGYIRETVSSSEPVPIKIYIAKEDSYSGAHNLFYVKLREGLYFDFDRFFHEVYREIVNGMKIPEDLL